MNKIHDIEVITLEQEIYTSTNELYDVLCQLRRDVLSRGDALFQHWLPQIQRTRFVYSAWNMAFYLALRCHDLRKIQRSLLPLGLSSLGRGEARAITNLDAVMASLGRICHEPEDKLIPYPQTKRFFYGDTLLAYNTGRIFGTTKTGTRIMVTLPTEAAEDGGTLIRNLVAAGMDCARINCAHDSREVWDAMISYIRQAEAETGHHCKVYMDLAGPKVRIASVLLRYGEAKVLPGEQVFLVSGAISSYPSDYTGNIVQSYIEENFIKKNSTNPNKAKKLIVSTDEAHRILKFEGARMFENALYRVARKRHTAPWLILQSVKDFAKYQDTEEILKSTETFMLFRHNYLDGQYIKDTTNLNQSQVDTVLNLGGTSEAKKYGELCLVDIPTKRAVFIQADYLKDSEFDVVETDVEKIAEHARMKQGA